MLKAMECGKEYKTLPSFFTGIIEIPSDNKTKKENIPQNNPATATVVNFGVFFLHLNEIEKNENPNAEKSPTNKPNKVPISRLLKAIKTIPMAATNIAVKVVLEAYS